MAITIDQFLRDLNERQALSGAELSAFRLDLASSAPAASANSPAARNGSSAAPVTQTAPAPDAAPLVLCDCVIKEKLKGETNHWVFSAAKLQDDAPATIHVLIPGGSSRSNGVHSGTNGAIERSGTSTPIRIASISRHGEIVCLCCEPIEAETLEELVNQHEGLPLELATETLLGVVQTLKAIQARGLELDDVSAHQLLLDEDGRTHLSGFDPGTLKLASRDVPGEPSSRLLAAFGQLFEFLHTGGAGSPTAMNEPAQIVFKRLLNSETSSGYRGWDELLSDLEALRDGREILETAAKRRKESPPMASRESGSNMSWLLIALAVLIGVGLVAWAVFGR